MFGIASFMRILDPQIVDAKKLRNRVNIIRDYSAGRAETPALPAEAIIEITNHCNLSCIMCPRPHMKRPKGFMEFDLFKSIIDQIRGHIELVYLSGGLGEPTLHPMLAEMINYCRANNVKVGVSTNASLLNKKVRENLLRNPPDIMLLSLDGITAATHEKIRVGSVFERTMGFVEAFLREKQERLAKLPYVVAQMVYMPHNQNEADEFLRYWREFEAVDDVRLKKFLHLQGANCVPPAGLSPQKKSCSCLLPWRQLSIAYDGTVALCCRDLDFVSPIGNATDTNLLEIWRGAQMVGQRELLALGRKSELPICRHCQAITPSAVAKLGFVVLDSLTIRRILPLVEKACMSLKLPSLDYE